MLPYLHELVNKLHYQYVSFRQVLLEHEPLNCEPIQKQQKRTVTMRKRQGQKRTVTNKVATTASFHLVYW